MKIKLFSNKIHYYIGPTNMIPNHDEYISFDASIMLCDIMSLFCDLFAQRKYREMQ